MERIELFDNYINNHLSDEQRSEFDERLKTDEKFSSDFKIYLLTVDGICRESDQDNLDFGIAMKKLTKEQLREIIGKNKSEETTLPIAASIPTELPNRGKLKTNPFRQWIWQAASIAAVIIIAFISVVRIEKSARYSVDEAIYSCADISTDVSRGGSELVSISNMSETELKAAIPELQKLYQEGSTPDEIADNGYTLAMVYLKFHERDKATEVLNQLISRFDGNEDYADSVNKWKSILNLIK